MDMKSRETDDQKVLKALATYHRGVDRFRESRPRDAEYWAMRLVVNEIEHQIISRMMEDALYPGGPQSPLMMRMTVSKRGAVFSNGTQNVAMTDQDLKSLAAWLHAYLPADAS